MCLTFVAVPLAGSAATIEVVSIYRSTSATATALGGTTGSDFDESFVTTGTLTSTAASTGFSAPDFPPDCCTVFGVARNSATFGTDSFVITSSVEGLAGDFVSGNVVLDAVWDETFDLTVTSDYSLLAVRNTSALQGTGRVTLFDDAGAVLIDTGTDGFLLTGELGAGRYRLLVTSHFAGGAGQFPDPTGHLFTTDFRFTPVPEPASAALLVLGLIALVARQRRGA